MFSKLVLLKSGMQAPLTSCLQLRSLKREGMPLWKGSAGVWRPHQRWCGELAPPTGSRVHVHVPGGELAQLNVPPTQHPTGTCGSFAAPAGPLLKRDQGFHSQFVPPLASWTSWNGLEPTSKSEQTRHVPCTQAVFLFFFLVVAAAAAAQCETKVKYSVWIFFLCYLCLRAERFLFFTQQLNISRG